MGWGGRRKERSREPSLSLYPFCISPCPTPSLAASLVWDPGFRAGAGGFGAADREACASTGSPGFQQRRFALLGLCVSIYEMELPFHSLPPSRCGGVSGRTERFVHGRELPGSAPLVESRLVSPASASTPDCAHPSAALWRLGTLVASALPLLSLPLWPCLSFSMASLELDKRRGRWRA